MCINAFKIILRYAYCSSLSIFSGSQSMNGTYQKAIQLKSIIKMV